jgi:hypothetical protein
MQKNTILATAITATLSTLNVAYAGTFANLTNTDCYKVITGTTVSEAAAAATACDSGTISITNQVAGFPVNYVPSEAETKPILYGTHIFGSASSGVILPSASNTPTTLPTTNPAIVKYTIEGSVGFDFEFKLTLSNGAKFSGEPKLYIDSATTNQATNGNSAPDPKSGCNSTAFCTWAIDLNDASFKNDDVFYVSYYLTNAQVLGTAGETIKMTARLGDAFTVIDEQEIAVAASVDPLEVKLESAVIGQIRVSVASNNTEFNSKGTTDELLNQYAAIIGYLTIENQPSVFANDGLTEWNLGSSTPNAVNVFKAATATGGNNTNLTITEGQFAASVTPTETSISTIGGVSLRKLDGTTIVGATTVTSTDASFDFTDAQLNTITLQSNGRVAIVVQADGKTAVNIGENNPVARFVLDYTETSGQQDIEYPTSEMRKFRQDGTSCWVYSVPPKGASDILNLRITNDSTIAGIVNGTLYSMAGGEPVFSKINLLGTDVELQPGATVRVTQAKIADDLEGGPYSWTGRGTLQITSTLPELEILTLLRSIQPGSPLTNMSVGAHGSACQN